MIELFQINFRKFQVIAQNDGTGIIVSFFKNALKLFLIVFFRVVPFLQRRISNGNKGRRNI
ncbi:hypothetical protein B8W99_25830 [Peribacillus simplex]|nr:hypothetical protein B8W99_25830 [Peribacillus simplex]